MRTWLYCVAILMFVLTTAPTSLADIALPPENRNTNKSATKARIDRLPSTGMVIERRKLETPEVRLQIPKSMLEQLRAEGLTGGDASNQTAAATGSVRPFQTIIAGLFLSLSVAFAGLWLVRSRRRPANRLAVTAIVTLASTCVLATLGYANIRPPVRHVDAGTLPRAVTNESLSGKVRVEIVSEGSEIKLLLPQE